MNRVHEQCPKIDSGIVLSQKRAKCTKCTALASPRAPRACPSARAPAPVPRTRLRPCRVARPAPSPASAQMGGSPFQVSAPIFFFFLVSSYWKIPKKYLYIFFFIFHNTQIKFFFFIKIYFPPFCSVLHCKTLEKIIFFNSHPINLLKFIFLHFLF